MEKLSWLPWRLPTHPLPLSWLIWVNPALHASWYSCFCFSLNTKLQPVGENIEVEAALARTAADLFFSWPMPPLTFWCWIELKAGNRKGGCGKCYQLKQYIRQNACSIDPAAPSPTPAPPKTRTSMSSALSKRILRFFLSLPPYVQPLKYKTCFLPWSHCMYFKLPNSTGKRTPQNMSAESFMGDEKCYSILGRTNTKVTRFIFCCSSLLFGWLACRIWCQRFVAWMKRNCDVTSSLI